MLVAAERGVGGAFNTVSRFGRTTMGELLATVVKTVGSDAELVWTPPEVIEEAGIGPSVELPIWLPDDAEYGGLSDGDVFRRPQRQGSPADRSRRRSPTPGPGSKRRATRIFERTGPRSGSTPPRRSRRSTGWSEDCDG